MKRILMLAAAALVIAPAAMAQIATTPFKVDKNALLKEIERTDKVLENEKRATKGQPWLDNGNAYYSAAAAIGSQIYSSMSLADLNAKLGKDAPKPVDKTLASGRTYQVISLPEVDIYLQNGIVQFWVEKVVIYDGAPEKALAAYKKSAELDSKLAPKAKEGLERVADIYRMKANTLYNTGENIPAAETYLKAYEVQKDPLVGVIDSGSVFNAGYLYVTNKNYDKAIEVFEDAVAHDVWSEGNIAYFLSWSYLQKGEAYYPKAKEILQRGIKLFPKNENIPEGLINYYSLAQDDFSEITGVLQDAIKKDPSKIVFWNGLGQAYLNMGDRAKTIEYFKQFVKAFPDDFGANYYLGDQLMEEAQALLKEAEENASMSAAQKKELQARAIELFREAFPVSEKAYLDRPNERAALQRVTRILFHLKDEPGMYVIFEKYHKIHEETM